MSLSEVYTNLLSFEKHLINRDATSNPPSNPVPIMPREVGVAVALVVTRPAAPMDLVTAAMSATMIGLAAGRANHLAP
jgi:hypothetical protein